MKFADRVDGLSVSPTLAVMQEAARMKAQGIDVIDLGPGEPDFPTPGAVRQAAIAAIEAHFTKYTAAAGIAELRRAVADRYNRDFGSRFGPENVILTCGAKQAIYSVVMALFQAGDQVIVPSPYWVTFPEAVKLTGAEPIPVPVPEADGFVLDVAHLEELGGDRLRGLIINSPNNPTGAVIPAENMQRLTEFCRRRGIFFVSDETYDRFTYDGRRHSSLASFVEPNQPGYAVCGSFSKTYSMTGWRVGYLIAGEDLIRRVDSLQSHLSGNVCSISQKAALAALEVPAEVIEEMLGEYASRRRFVLDRLANIPGIECPVPYGAFYAFPNITRCLDESGMDDSVEFSRFLITQARIAVVPGSAFGSEGYIRLSYATSMENLEVGLQRLEESIRSLPASR